MGSLPHMRVWRLNGSSPHKEYGKSPSHKCEKTDGNVSTWRRWEVYLTWGYEEWWECLHMKSIESLSHMRVWRIMGTNPHTVKNMGRLPHIRVWRMFGMYLYEEPGKSSSNEDMKNDGNDSTWRIWKNMRSLPHIRVIRLMVMSPYEEYGASPSHEGEKNDGNVSTWRI